MQLFLITNLFITYLGLFILLHFQVFMLLLLGASFTQVVTSLGMLVTFMAILAVCLMIEQSIANKVFEMRHKKYETNDKTVIVFETTTA